MSIVIMILPIVAYNAPILKRPCETIDANYPQVDELIASMWNTLYNANGCGLAAPQVNISARLFIVDSKLTFGSMTKEARARYFDGDEGIQEVFINPQILARSREKLWEYDEGCLSIPELSGTVERPWQIDIIYSDAKFHQRLASFSGMTARMIQHEYDHLEGKLYLDYLSSLKHLMIRRKLNKIAKGKITCRYPLIYPPV